MTPVNLHDPSQDPSAAQSSRLDRLEQEFEKLKEGLEKENRGVVGWAKKYGAVVALIVAAVAVPRGFIDLYHVVWGRPHTEVVPGNYVTMGYNPARKSVSFTLGFGLANSGTKDDFVNDWNATIKNTSVETSPPVTFTPGDIECSSQGILITIPYPLHTSTPISMSCKLEKRGSDFLQQSGTYQIEVNVSGAASKKQTVSYCFDLGDKVISEVNDSKISASKTILKNPDCEL